MKRIIIGLLIILVLITGCSQISPEDSKIPIKKDISYDYEILYFGDLGYDFDNYYVLLLSDIPEQDFSKFFYYVREKECKNRKCNIGFFDDREAYNLMKESSADDEDYVTEHFIGMLTIDPNNEIIMYPLKDSRFSMTK